MSQSPDKSVLCVCVDVRKGAINVGNVLRPVFIMQLHSDGIELQIIKFFNAKWTKAGNYTVRHNSDFAKLYRLTVGENPTKRFSEAQKLMKHFLGHSFIIEGEQVMQNRSGAYLKVDKIKPVDPIKSDSWDETGGQKHVPKRRGKLGKIRGNLVENPGKFGGKFVENSGKFGGKFVDAKSLQGAKTLGLQPFSTPQQHNNTTTHPSNNTVTQQHSNTDVVADVEVDVKQTGIEADAETATTLGREEGKTPMMPKTQHFVHQQRPGETKEEYWGRVIDESLPDWKDKDEIDGQFDYPDDWPLVECCLDDPGVCNYDDEEDDDEI